MEEIKGGNTKIKKGGDKKRDQWKEGEDISKGDGRR